MSQVSRTKILGVVVAVACFVVVLTAFAWGLGLAFYGPRATKREDARQYHFAWYNSTVAGQIGPFRDAVTCERVRGQMAMRLPVSNDCWPL